jgi:signal transduction histidine kinase
MRQLLDKMAYMHRLNHDLFELSKLESKKLSFEFEKVGLHDFIQDVFRRFEPDLLRENRILQLGRVETIIEGKEGFMFIDKLRIIQVLQNYMENAVKFSDPSDSIILLNCYVRQNGSEWDNRKEMCVEVRDHGKGITKEELPYVFNRFYKKSEGNERGSGLGLAISKEIIEQHEGRVCVESEIGKGSLFYFWLPLL